MKESIVIYARQRMALKRLTDAQRGVLLDALLTYAGGEEPTFTDGMVMVAFDFFRTQIDIDRAKYDEVCEKRREAGRNGGLAKKANATKCYQMQAKESKRKHDNDNNNDNENENVNENVVIVPTAQQPPQRKTAKFVKPTIEEIRAYTTAKHYTFDAEAFFAYYESNGWKVGRNPMKDWRMACTTWQKKQDERRKNTPSENNEDKNEQIIRQTYEILNENKERAEAGYYDDTRLPF